MRRLVLVAGMLGALLALALRAGAQSGIDGTLVDGTSGGPGTADRVNLLHLQGGMAQVGLLERVSGKFHFDVKAPGPYLVQAQKNGVSYNQMVPPQERGVATPEITVYDSTTDTGAMTVAVHWVVIVDGPRIHVSRVFQISNSTSPPRAIVGAGIGAGAFRFDVPDGADQVSASVTSARMPLRQDPVETPDGRGKTVAYGIKPGETRLEVEYEIPYSGSATLPETLYHGARSLSAVVVPADVTVESAELGAPERQERQGVAFWVFSGADLPAGKVLTLKVRGQGTAPRPPGSQDGGREAGSREAGSREAGSGEAGSGDAAGDEMGGDAGGGSPDLAGAVIKEVPPESARGAARPIILVAGAALLLAALVMALGRPRPDPAGAAAPVRKLTLRAEQLLDELAALDSDLAAGRIGEADHQEQRATRKRLLLDELEAVRRKQKLA